MKKLPVGLSDFKQIVKNNYYFIDKSLFIKEIIDEDAAVLLLPRPRRFGKSFNLSQLYYYFNINEKESLFADLKISRTAERYQKEKNKYPVIKIDFKGVSAVNWTEAAENLKRIIASEYKNHYYLFNSELLMDYEKDEFKKIIDLSADISSYKFSLEKLSDYLARFHKQKAIILIDEYDEPIQSGYLNDYYQQIISFMRTFLIRALKDNNNVEKGILTGVLRIARESIFSGLNNLVVSSLLDEKYNQYFGLLTAEVEKIFRDFDLEYKLAEIKQWYNGYNFGGEIIYNPWSIINCIYQKGELNPYWVNTSDNQLVKDLILKSANGLKKDLEQLLIAESIKVKIEENLVFNEIQNRSSTVWTFLLFSGYLKAENFERIEAKLYADLKIPNQELKYIYEEIISDWFQENLSNDKIEQLLEALITADFDVFEALLSEFVLNSFSFFDTAVDQAEQVYHSFILGLLLNLENRYYLKSNRESGYGRYDIMLIPKAKKDKAIIIEFKKALEFKDESLEKAADSGLKQIEEKNYRAELNEKENDGVIEIAVAFSGTKLLLKGREI
ncbi:MAG: Protein of unknown function (DUF1703)/Predicted AAA-ATPase [Halanaerobium sp. T82-1]|jgi:hypothetical protein|nr:MAG: Protein of unknown function (DUF1703)/Predicted AAA-ATPase [Halanaerobium sp. T82-1]